MKKLFLLFICLGLASFAWAQVQLTAQVDKTDLTLDDELTLTIRIRGTVNPRPQLPSLPAFNVYSQLQSSSFINGQTLHEFRYVMMPRMVGNATIGAVTLDYKGQIYRTEPIEVHIYRDGSRNTRAATSAQAQGSTNYDSSITPPIPQAQRADGSLPPLERNLADQAYQRGIKEPFFLISAVSNAHPYAGQTFTLGVRFYYSQQFPDNAPYQAPEVSNLLMDDLGKTEGTQTINGRLFRYHEMRYQLSGAAPGEALIGSARIEFGNSPFDWFDRIFGGVPMGTGPRTFTSAPIRLQIQNLPGDKPSSFYGAVGGGFTIASAVDSATVEAGDSVNWSVTVAGPAGLKSTLDLNFPQVPGFKSYPVAPTFSSGKRNSKTFKTVLVPSASGIYTLPPVEWSYFDPATQQYKTLQTQPITLTVTPSSSTKHSVDFSTQLPSAGGVQTLGNDIHYLKTQPTPQPGWLVRMSQLSVVNWICAGLVFLAIVIRFTRKKDRSKHAYSQARHLLSQATSCEQIAEALSFYLSKRLSISTGSLPLKEVVVALQKRGYTASQTEPFATLWQALEEMRFAPGADASASVKQQAQRAKDVLKILEEKAK